MEKDDGTYLDPIQQVDYRISDDDAYHLSAAINRKCQRFVTIDEYLLSESCKSKIKQNFGLIITHPKKT